MIVTTDRSRIEAYQKCNRLRFEQYEYLGKGLDLDQSARALNIGSCVHKAVEQILIARRDLGPDADSSLQLGLNAALNAPEYLQLDVEDDRDTVEALVRTWWFVGLPTLTGWEVLDVEKEESFDYPGVRFLSRSDYICRASEGLYLNSLPTAPGLYNWNLKTWKTCDKRRRESLKTDAQVYTELLGPEKRMGEHFAGVIYQVLVKENHPLVYAWKSAKRDHVVSRYSWNCTEAHENTHTKNGGWCAGGKFHRLGDDYQPLLVRDMPGGQAVWFERVCEKSPASLQDAHVILGPMMRPSDYIIEDWLESNLPREVSIRIARDEIMKAHLDNDRERVEHLLRTHFPKETAHGNCEFPFECPAKLLCHGGAARENFNYRVPNHPEGV